MKNLVVCLASVVGMFALWSPVFATELVYQPFSPTFGGSSANGTFLLSTAQAASSSTNAGPDLSGLTSALGNLQTLLATPIVVIQPTTIPTNP